MAKRRDRRGVCRYRGDHRNGGAQPARLSAGIAKGRMMADQTERTEPTFRRVVTRHDANGTSVFWMDGNATNHKFPSEKISSTLMWSTDQSPTHLLSEEDEGARV